VPNIDYVVDQLRFVVQTSPGDMARLVRVVLEGKELQILHALVLAQVCEKAPQPRCSSLRIGPGLDFLVHSLKAGAAQLQRRIDLVQRRRIL
jgi:hypothetical protein